MSPRFLIFWSHTPRVGWEGKDEDAGEDDTDAGRLKFWLKFMEKWGYQPAQKQVIRQVADSLLQGELSDPLAA